MKKLAIVLTLFLATNVYAGAGWICDDYGHSCLSPGGHCNGLVPPTHFCSENEVSSPETRYINKVLEQENASPEIKAGACCSWGENIEDCWPGC
jgi:hypothetical protein